MSQVGQSSDCLWECCADQLNRSETGRDTRPRVSTELLKGKCIDWLRAHEHYAMGLDCSLPTAQPVPDDGADHGTRCTLGEYVRARWGLAWHAYVDAMARGWAGNDGPVQSAPIRHRLSHN